MIFPRTRWFLVFILVLSSLWFAKGVPIREDALDLLPGEQVRDDLALLREIGLVDRVFLSFELTGNGSVDALQASVRNVGASLEDSPYFSQVVYQLPKGFEFIIAELLFPALPNLFGSGDLAWLAPRLTDEGVRQIMAANFALLNSPAGLAVKKQLIRDPLGLLPHFLKRLQELRGELAVSMQDGLFMSRDGKHCLLWAESVQSLTDSKQAARVDSFVQQVLAEELAPGIKARIIGPLPHTLANARTVQKDLKRLLPLALISLLILLILTLKKLRAVFVVAIPFLAAPVALAVVGKVFGSISIMALGFGIVLLGISVDFAVHIYLARTRGPGAFEDRLAALRRPIAMASATTLGVFVVLLFSSVPSHRQMALLALVGVGLAVVFSWLLVPSLAGDKKNSFREKQPALPWTMAMPQWFGWLSVALWLGLLIGGLLAWPKLHFSGDLRALDVHSAEIAENEEVFGQVWRQNEEQIFIVVEGRDFATALDKNDRVDNFLRQKEGLVRQTLAGVLPGPAVQKQNRAAWKKFWTENNNELAARFDRIGAEFGFVPGAHEPFFDWLAQEIKPLQPESLLQSPLGPVFLSLVHFSDDQEAGDDQRPVLITTLVEDKPEFRPIFVDLENQLDGVRVVSPGAWRITVEDLLQKDIIRLSLAAGLFILVLVSLFFRETRGVAGALAPVLAALSAMAIFDYYSTRDLNLMHLLMVIMVIGLAVDYGIFAVCAARQQVDRTALLGVSICAASTVSGFGVLALAVHPALHALGATVLVGIGAAWPTAVLVTPIIAGCPKGCEE